MSRLRRANKGKKKKIMTFTKKTAKIDRQKGPLKLSILLAFPPCDNWITFVTNFFFY